MRHYTLKIKTLSPIYIGSGKKVGKKEYIYDRKENKLYLFDKVKLFRGLAEKEFVNEYQKFMLRNSPREDLNDFFQEMNIRKSQYKEWISYVAEMGSRNLINRSTHQIDTFVKDSYGHPYIPGSSLKGMIRTVLEYVLIKENQGKFSKIKKNIETEAYQKRDNYHRKNQKDLGIQIFHRNITKTDKIQDMQNDIMRGLIVSDSKPIRLQDLCICQKIDVSVDGKEQKMPLLRECIHPNTVIEIPLTIDTSIFPYSIEYIYESINVFYQEYQTKIVNSFHKIPKSPQQKGITYLGGGVGYANKTVIYALYEKTKAVEEVSKILDNTVAPRERKKHNHLKDTLLGVSPHTLKCTEYRNQLYQMGLLQIQSW